MGFLRTAIPVTIGVGAVYFIWQALVIDNAIDKLRFEPQGVSFQGLSNFKLNLLTNVNIINPVNKTFTVESLYLDMVLPNGTTIGQVRVDNLNFKVPGKTTTPFALPTSTSIINAGMVIIQQVMNFFTGGASQFPDSIKLIGNTRINGFLIDINQDVPLTKQGVAGLGKVSKKLSGNFDEYPIFHKKDGQQWSYVSYIFADSFDAAKKQFAKNMTSGNWEKSNNINWLESGDYKVTEEGWYDLNNINRKTGQPELFVSKKDIDEGFTNWSEDTHNWELRDVE